MSEDLRPKCYNCEKIMDAHPPYFCSDKCKLAYWHESPDQPQTRIPKTIPQIQARLLEMAKTAPPAEVEAADFFAHIPIYEPNALPTAFGRGGVEA